MFTGEHDRLLDSGLRVILPKDWRGLKISEFFLISGSAEPYIKAMPRSEYDKAVAEITNDPALTRLARNTHLRSLGSKCKRVTLDSSGRLTMPAELCKEIGVSVEKPDIVLLGAVTAFEIWNPKGLKDWERKQAQPDEAGHPRMNVKEFLGV